MDFLFHQVSEKEREEIKKQAKGIMDSFSKKISKVDKKTAEPLIERNESERVEGKGSQPNEVFRRMVLENAPEKNQDFIIAEKKKW